MRMIWASVVLALWSAAACAQDGVFEAVAAYRDGGGARVCDPEFDATGRPADIAELESSLYVPYGDVGSGRVIYILTAPWCPFCRSILRQDPSVLRGIELRMVVGGLTNASDFPRYYRLAREGRGAVRAMFTGPPPVLGDVAFATSKQIVDAMLLNAHALEMRHMAIHSYLQRIGEARAGPFGYPAFLVPTGQGEIATVTPIMASLNLDAVRADGPYRMGGTPAPQRAFVRSPPAISPLDRGTFTWENGVRVQAYPAHGAPGFCYDGRVSLFVTGALRTEEGLWAYVEALDLIRASGAGGGYLAHGYAFVPD